MHHHGVTFNFGYASMCSPTMHETCFYCDKDIWIAAADCRMYYCIILLYLSIYNYTPIN